MRLRWETPAATLHAFREEGESGISGRKSFRAAAAGRLSRFGRLWIHHALPADFYGAFGQEVAGEEVFQLAVEPDRRFFVAEPVALPALGDRFVGFPVLLQLGLEARPIFSNLYFIRMADSEVRPCFYAVGLKG